MPETRRQLHVVEGRLDIALGREEGVVGPELDLGQRTARAQALAVRHFEIAVRPPAVDDEPEISTLLLDKKDSDFLSRFGEGSLTMKAPVKPRPVMWLLHGRVRLALEQTQCRQAC